jgi:hypothetical protein
MRSSGVGFVSCEREARTGGDETRLAEEKVRKERGRTLVLVNDRPTQERPGPHKQAFYCTKTLR